MRTASYRNSNSKSISVVVNVHELCMSDIKYRISMSPSWVRKMPVQGQRRWLVCTFPNEYVVGPQVTGSVGGHKKHRGVWSVNELRAYKGSNGSTSPVSSRVDWTSIMNSANT